MGKAEEILVMERFLNNRNFKITLIVLTLGWIFLFLKTIDVPLQGTHRWRQADTLFSSYYFCTEETNILYPRIGPRQNTAGVAIGEFPLYSYVTGMACRLTGGWSEVTPKIVSLIFTLLGIFLWWRALQKNYKLQNLQFAHWFSISFFSVISLSFMTIPMPESLAFCIFGLSALLWADFKEQKIHNKLLGSLAFSLGFLLRPYHIPFLTIFRPRWKTFGFTLLMCIVLFVLWYKVWAASATQVFGHYGIGFESFDKILAAIPGALLILPKRLLDHTGVVGLVAMVLAFRVDRWLHLIYVGSIGLMLILKPTHLANHAYYLSNSAFIALMILAIGFNELKKDWQRNAFILVYVIYGLAATQHNLTSAKQRIDWERLEALSVTVPVDKKVITYTGDGPQELYLMKRMGWVGSELAFNPQSPCPEGADFYLLRAENSNYNLLECPR